MKRSDIPARFQIPFANDAGAGYLRSIPLAPTGLVGQASLQTGFPPANFTPVSAGGVPPFGQDMNGILNQVSAWNWYSGAGGGIPTFDGTWSGLNGGYPQGAVLQSTASGQLWLNLADDNGTDPDSGGTNWVPIITGKNLTTVIDFYLSPTGNDNNNGLSPATPFQTLPGAVSKINSRYGILAGANLNFAHGTYVGASLIGSQIAAWNLIGDNASPGSVVIDSTSTANNFGRGLIISNNAYATIQGLRFVSAYENISLGGGQAVIKGSCAFVGPTVSAIPCIGSYNGSFCTMQGSHTYAGTMGAFITASENSGISIGYHDGLTTNTFVLTVLTSVTFSGAFAIATMNSSINIDSTVSTFSGSATGGRYVVSAVSVINTGGAGATYLPGSSAGATSTGGQYI